MNAERFTSTRPGWHTPAVLLFVLLLTLANGCNEELGPVNEPSGFSGVIRFRNWPPPDSVREMRLVVFQDVPRDSAEIIASLLARRAAAYPPLGTDFPMYIDSLPYVFTTKSGTNLQVTNYAYVAVVQQYGPNVLHDWQPAGVYSAPNSTDPLPVRVILHRVISNIDIMVDFHNPPPKPW